MGLPSEETWRKEIPMKREIFTWRALLSVLTVAIFALVLAGSGAASDHPKAEHPKAEKPKSEHPAEHPKAEHPKAEKPESEHPTEHNE